MPARKSNPVLKWRKVNGEWRSGPFSIIITKGGPNYWPGIDTEYRSGGLIADGQLTLAAAKSACEALAQSILRACAKGKWK